MRRYTDNTLRFKLKTDIELGSCQNINVILKDNYKILVFEKNELQIDEESKTITLKLNQEQTGKLAIGTCRVQVRLLNSTGVCFASAIGEIEVQEILENKVLKPILEEENND